MTKVKRIHIDTGDFNEERYPIPPKRVERSEKECVHTPQPPRGDYFAWQEWAHRASKSHSQITCPVCGRWEIWLPKKEAQAIRRQDAKESKAFAEAYNRDFDRRLAESRAEQRKDA